MKDQELVNPSRYRFVAILLVIGITMSVTILAGAVFVWPTVYRYDHMTVQGNVYLVRIHRFSERTEILYMSGWQLVMNPVVELSKGEDRTVPPEELAKLSATGRFNPNGHLYVDVYNASTWRIKAVVVSVSARPSDGQVNPSSDISDIDAAIRYLSGEQSSDVQGILSRQYRLKHSGYIDPLSTGNMSTLVGFSLAEGQILSCLIVSATGIPQ